MFITVNHRGHSWSDPIGIGVGKDAFTEIRMLRSKVSPLILKVSASLNVTAELTIRKYLA